jgi:3-oxo-5-alpha-steroid 4-dehydrogenase 3
MVQIDDLHCALAFALLTVGSLIATIVPPIRCITQHGKGLKHGNPNVLASRILTVPKSYFRHMYVVGILSGLYFAMNAISRPTRLHILHQQQTYVVFAFYLFQVGRRSYETFYLTIYGESRMHMAAYLLGLVYYILVPMSLSQQASSATSEAVPVMFARLLLAFAVFVVSSFAQYETHAQLFKNKLRMMNKRNELDGDSEKMQYPLPRGLMFDWVLCPHYTAEIGVYLSFVLVRPYNLSSWAMLVWVIANLSVSADNHYRYYCVHGPTEDLIAQKKIRRILPGIW